MPPCIDPDTCNQLITFESVDQIAWALNGSKGSGFDPERWQQLTGDAAVLGDLILTEWQTRWGVNLSLRMPTYAGMRKDSLAYGWVWWAAYPEYEQPLFVQPNYTEELFVPNVEPPTEDYQRCRLLLLLEDMGLLPNMFEPIVSLTEIGWDLPVTTVIMNRQDAEALLAWDGGAEWPS